MSSTYQDKFSNTNLSDEGCAHVTTRKLANDADTGHGPCSFESYTSGWALRLCTRQMYRTLPGCLVRRAIKSTISAPRISTQLLNATSIPIRSFSTTPRLSAAYNMPQDPKIVKVEELPATEAKWIEFQKISWQGRLILLPSLVSHTDPARRSNRQRPRLGSRGA